MASTSALVPVQAVLAGEQRSLEVRFGLIDLGCGDAGTKDPKKAELKVPGMGRVHACELP